MITVEENEMNTVPISINPADQAAVIQNLSEKLKANYIFPDIAERISELIQNCLADGEYAQLTDGELFAKTLTGHLRQVNQDKHLRVFYHPEPLPELDGPLRENPEIVAEWRQVDSLHNFGLYKVERLAGNVGYLDIRWFAPPKWAGDTAAAAMNFLANASALIVDLRKNGGGHPSMVAFLCSYLLGDEPVHLTTFHWRAEESSLQSWTLPYVPGMRFGGKPIYVLSSKDTFSGGEEFAYNLQTNKRATLVGETTGGAANPGGVHRLHPHFDAFIPDGRPVNPITRTNWEGSGVIPDVEADPEQAFQVAYRMALQAIIESVAETASMPFRDLKKEAQTALDELESK